MIIFASKSVGVECLRFLLRSAEQIDVVLIAGHQDVDIVELCELHALEWHFYERDSLLNILSHRRISKDWLLNLWSPFVLEPKVLNLVTRRLNIHPGLVPNCRGNDTAAWSIRRNLPAGVSLIEIDEDIDSGGVYCQQEITVSQSDTGRSLYNKQVATAVSLFRKAWPAIRSGNITPSPQKAGGSYFTRKMTNQDRRREFSSFVNSDDFERWVRAHDFYPNTTAELAFSDGRIYKLFSESM